MILRLSHELGLTLIRRSLVLISRNPVTQRLEQEIVLLALFSSLDSNAIQTSSLHETKLQLGRLADGVGGRPGDVGHQAGAKHGPAGRDRSLKGGLSVCDRNSFTGYLSRGRPGCPR